LQKECFELGTEYRGHSNIYIYEYELIKPLVNTVPTF